MYNNRSRNSYSRFNNRPKFGGRKNNSRKNFGEKIDVSRFVKKATESVCEEIEIKNTFVDFGFVSQIYKNLEVNKYSVPTPIQDQAISHIMQGRDIIGIASTGTGKTGAFLLPLINKAYLNRNQKVLIITPTRELALQIADEFHSFSFDMRIFSAFCVGGMPINKQIANLRRNPQFVIGTPGRLKDMFKRNLLNYSQFQNIVLDEVDRMLDMGFVNDIRAILEEFPKNRQSLFFSATLPPKIKTLTQEFLHDPVTISLNVGQTAQNIDQDIVKVGTLEKFSKLQSILSQDGFEKVLIFSETKRDVEKLTNGLIQCGFKAESIHGDKRQSQRQRALNLFKCNDINILVATDVAARGLDIKDVSHVINYTLPQTYDDYIHRIGRTGRAHKKGVALTFV